MRFFLSTQGNVRLARRESPCQSAHQGRCSPPTGWTDALTTPVSSLYHRAGPGEAGGVRVEMTKAERIHRAVERRPVDRPPVSFWRHFPHLDEDPFALAEAVLAFHARYDLDFIKVMPTGVYCVEDWGCRVAYEGDIDGSRVCLDHAVRRPGDWANLRPLHREEARRRRAISGGPPGKTRTDPWGS